MQQSSSSQTNQSLTPLCVDLDGTLLSSDMLFESFFSALRLKPFSVLAAGAALLRSDIPGLKELLARNASISIDSLPWNEELVEFLREESARGRKIYLVTASHELLAAKVAEHFAFFESVHATTAGDNLKGKRKAEFLSEKFAGEGFAYIGDSSADIPVWKAAKERLAVDPSSGAKNAFSNEGFHREFRRQKASVLTWVKAIRVHQWVKNLLLFVPLLMAHQFTDPASIFAVLLGILSYSLTASSVYLFNDLIDLESDRRHHSKCNRPLAAGRIPLIQGGLAGVMLLCSGFALSFLLPLAFTLTLSFYYCLTFFYSLRGKQLALFDILLLASLYSLRVLAGGHAASVYVSEWLLAFSMFLFLSLAAVKRFTELEKLRTGKADKAHGRGYRVSDLPVISGLGLTSGYISVLVLALYLNAKDAQRLYAHPELLWLMCFPLLYWISRVWLLAFRSELHDDPIVFALKDKTSYFVGVLCLAILLVAI